MTSNKEYWQMTEVFVYLHGGDVCNDSDCPHCGFLSRTFDLEDKETEGE